MTINPARCLYRLCLTVLLLAGFALPADAADLTEANLKQVEALGLFADYLVENENQPLNIHQARAAFQSGRFAPSQTPVLSFGFTKPGVWVRLGFRNTESAPRVLRLLVDSSWQDSLDFYFVAPDGTIEKQQRGDNFPFAQRGNDQLAFSVEYAFAPGTTEIFIRTQTGDALVTPIYLLTPEVAEQRSSEQGFSYGFLYGYLGALLAFNLVLFVTLRDRRHLLYALVMVTFVLLNLAYSGHGYRWLWPQAVAFQRWIVGVFIVAYCCSSIVFAMRFLDTRTHMPRTARFLVWSMYGFTAAIVGCALLTGDAQPTYRIAFSFVAFFSLAILWLGLVSLRSGISYARYFLSACVASMLGSTVTALSVWGVLTFTSWTHRAAEIGMIVDATLLAVALGIDLRSLQHRSAHAEQRASRDALTDLYNRRAFMELAQPLWHAAVRDNAPLAVVMLDIDHFKSINDSYGHRTGDVAITAVARALSRTVRGADLVARWGGEEFLVLLPATTIESARLLAERLRRAVATLHVPHERGDIRLTASLGVCARSQHHSLEQLIHSADLLLYEAKVTGRDRICSGSVEIASPG